jgi:hypothetical protein
LCDSIKNVTTALLPAAAASTQLSSALELPLRGAEAQPQQQQGAAGVLDIDVLAAAVPSRLLVSLLAAAGGPDVAGAAAEVLSRLDAAAAAKNDFLALFKSQPHFPEVRHADHIKPPMHGIMQLVVCGASTGLRAALLSTLQSPLQHMGRCVVKWARASAAAMHNKRTVVAAGLQVFGRKAAVAAAESHLQELLPKLAAAAGVRGLSYVSIQNQGNYLVELPAARTDVPPGWDKVGVGQHDCCTG